MSADSTTNREDDDAFVGENQLLRMFYDQLHQFEDWNQQKDWLAFHNHHYDWWIFPSSCFIIERTSLFDSFSSILVDEISSRGRQFQLTPTVIVRLRQNSEFIKSLRRAVELLMQSWAWVNRKRSSELGP